MDTNWLTRIGIKPKSTAPEADALTSRPSELFQSLGNICSFFTKMQSQKGGGHIARLNTPMTMFNSESKVTGMFSILLWKERSSNF